MLRMRHCWVFAAVILGCSQSYPLASRFVLAVPVDAAQGGVVQVTASDSAELAGAKLVIPAGALSSNKTITLEIGVENITQGTNLPASAVAAWGPAGEQLALPGEVTLPFTLEAGDTVANLRIDAISPTGERTALDRVGLTVDATNKTVTFRTTVLAAFQAVSARCDNHEQCPAGSTCGDDHQCHAPTCGEATCDAGQLCCAGICTTPETGTDHCPAPQCSADVPCPTGTACEAGTCHLQCGDNYPGVTCPEGTTCQFGICWYHQAGCTADSDCDAHNVCDNGTCRLRCGPDFPDVHCPAPQNCVENYVCR